MFSSYQIFGKNFLAPFNYQLLLTSDHFAKSEDCNIANWVVTTLEDFFFLFFTVLIQLLITSFELLTFKPFYMDRFFNDTLGEKFSFTQLNGGLAASDLFRMFTQSIKFHYDVLRAQKFEKCDWSNRR